MTTKPKRIERVDFVFQAFWQFIHLPIVPFAAQVVVVGGFTLFMCVALHTALYDKVLHHTFPGHRIPRNPRKTRAKRIL